MAKSANNSISKKIGLLDMKVEWFYGDDFSLDQASEHYREAVSLAREIEEDLDELQNEIEVLSKDFEKDFEKE